VKTYGYIEMIPTVFTTVKNYLEQNPIIQLPPMWAEHGELVEEVRNYVDMLGVEEMADWSDGYSYHWL
jgi:hypothetical protein